MTTKPVTTTTVSTEDPTTTQTSPSTSDTSTSTSTTQTETTQGTDDSTSMTTAPPPVCGNGGDAEMGEDCDDGDVIDNNDCTNLCKDATCGDSIVWNQGMGKETCESGKDANGNDIPNCGMNGEACTYCGDSVVNGTEECDDGLNNKDPDLSDRVDGNLDATSFCSTKCTRNYRIVFNSSAVYQGSVLGGVEGANAKCNELTQAVPSLKKLQFSAWISTLDDPMTVENDEQSPDKDWKKSIVPYVLPTTERTIVTLNYAELTTKTLQAPILIDETSSSISGEILCDGAMCAAWTNTRKSGKPEDGNDCGRWQVPDNATGNCGIPSTTDGNWTNAQSNPSCDDTTNNHLYCFEQW